MKRRDVLKRIGEGLLASLVAAAIVGLVGWVLSRQHIRLGATSVILVAASLAGLLALAAVWGTQRRRTYRFVPYLNRAAISQRIENASDSIWSFQISGSGFTTNSVDIYERWLRGNPRRTLHLLFANPTNDGLLS
jgi:hypothetical protein